MKIGIDIRSTVKRKTGIGYYTVNLINYLGKADIQNKYYLYSEIGLFNKDKKLPPLPGNNFKHRVNRLKLNPVFILSGLDIIHTQSYDLSCPKKSKLILVVHDVIHKAYPAGHASQTIRDVEQKMLLALERADRVIVSSLATRNDLMKFYRFDPDKVRLIYPGANEDLSLIPDISDGDKKALKRKYKINSPFILYVGTLEPRKNVEGLINAYKILKDDFKIRQQLVIAGMKGWMYEKIFSLVNEYQLQPEIVFTDYVSREDLKALYRMAEVFVYPSFYEGVGLPVLEAFNFGLPVVASRDSSVGEIAADAAVLIDPYKPEDIVQAILTIIGDEKFKQDLIKKGFRRAKEFSWIEAARKTIGVFNEFA